MRLMLMETSPSSRPPRSPLSVPVSVTPQDGTVPPQRLVSGNVSLGGMFIRSSLPLLPGARIVVTLEALGRPMMLADAEVVWSSTRASGLGAGFGVRFTRLHPEARLLLESLLRDPLAPTAQEAEPNLFIDPDLGSYRVPPELGQEPVTVPDGLAALLVAQHRVRRSSHLWTLGAVVAVLFLGAALAWLVR